MQPNDLIKAATKWAVADARICAMALVGSHARGEVRPDSDIDLIIVSKNPHALLHDQSWTRQFGPGTISTIEDYGLVQSVRVFYDDGAEVEFGVTSLEWTNVPLDDGTVTVMLDGLRILYDPQDRLDRALAFGRENSRMRKFQM